VKCTQFHEYHNELWVFSNTLAMRPDGYVAEEKGVIIVDELRAILLMEADFNFGNKIIFGQCMMFAAEDHDEVADECFGSRRNY
jgi:hypothetical protein